MPRTAVIIPARLASSRFPAKPLAPLIGADGVSRPALSYSWDAAQAAARALPDSARCFIATDDDRIAALARSLGMDAIMTPSSCRNGTERCAVAMADVPNAPEIIVNLQGDAPLTPPDMVSSVVALLEKDETLAMATAAVPASAAVLAHLQRDAGAGRVGGTTVACTRDGRALYFSKSIIPHVGRDATPALPVLLHVGLYAYRPAALRHYFAMEPAPLEEQEGLEQLRFLDAGLPVGVVQCPQPAWDMIELNNPTDVPLIEAELARRAEAELC